MRFRRGAEPPDDVRAGLGLAKGEKVLAAAALADGAWAVGSEQRLLVGEPGGDVRVDRGWHEVDTASWDGDAGVLAVLWVSGERTWLTLADAGSVRLPTVLRERVESTVVVRHRVSVRGRGGAQLVVRRVGDTLVLQTLLDRGTDPSDPAVAQALQDGRAEVRGMVGPLDGA